VAVPLFFLISGYLFFLGSWSWEKYVGKLKRRFHTLLIPYLFWNLSVLAFFAIAQSFPQTKMLASSVRFPPVHSFSFFDYVNALFGMTANYPIAGQFWFIRDLMVFVILAPAIHFILARKSALPFVAILFCVWFLGLRPVLWPSLGEIFFFILGAYLSSPGKNLTYLDKFGPWITTMFFGSLILNAAFPNDPLHLHNIVIFFGVPSLWWLTALAVRTAKLKSLLVGLSGASFFVFAAHLPLLTIIIRTFYKLLSPTSGLANLALYFLIPICLIAFLVGLYRCLMKALPAFLCFITGSSYRSDKQAAPSACLH
jgi:surface polysaccharide O-acyltransferase-like enzyme